MRAAAFKELLTSQRRAGQKRRGLRKHSRTTVFDPDDDKTLRADLGQAQAEFEEAVVDRAQFATQHAPLGGTLAGGEGGHAADHAWSRTSRKRTREPEW